MINLLINSLSGGGAERQASLILNKEKEIKLYLLENTITYKCSTKPSLLSIIQLVILLR